ncbi:MAG: peptidoglycan editing factor PgeF [Candidatus Omnitrophica bacterium]|nr:peptidoglycan editing factor PgeF [Candidatus Omnitrophota bacterium]
MAEQNDSKSKNGLVFNGLFDGELTAGFSSRSYGNMSLNYGGTEASLDNRKYFLKSLNVDYRSLVCAKQTHGVNIKRPGLLQKGNGALEYESALADTDAIITDQKNLPVAIFTADCLSIFLYDALTRSIGLIHAGWRGTQGNLVAKTIEAMRGEFNCRPENIHVFFGPVIRSCCYEVGKDFQDKFPKKLLRRGGKFFLDLAEINRQQLSLCGIKPGNITESSICTSCRNEEYFSFRKEGESCGRIMSVMMLK